MQQAAGAHSSGMEYAILQHQQHQQGSASTWYASETSDKSWQQGTAARSNGIPMGLPTPASFAPGLWSAPPLPAQPGAPVTQSNLLHMYPHAPHPRVQRAGAKGKSTVRKEAKPEGAKKGKKDVRKGKQAAGIGAEQAAGIVVEQESRVEHDTAAMELMKSVQANPAVLQNPLFVSNITSLFQRTVAPNLQAGFPHKDHSSRIIAALMTMVQQRLASKPLAPQPLPPGVPAAQPPHTAALDAAPFHEVRDPLGSLLVQHISGAAGLAASATDPEEEERRSGEGERRGAEPGVEAAAASTEPRAPAGPSKANPEGGVERPDAAAQGDGAALAPAFSVYAALGLAAQGFEKPLAPATPPHARALASPPCQETAPPPPVPSSQPAQLPSDSEHEAPVVEQGRSSALPEHVGSFSLSDVPKPRVVVREQNEAKDGGRGDAACCAEEGASAELQRGAEEAHATAGEDAGKEAPEAPEERSAGGVEEEGAPSSTEEAEKAEAPAQEEAEGGEGGSERGVGAGLGARVAAAASEELAVQAEEPQAEVLPHAVEQVPTREGQGGEGEGAGARGRPERKRKPSKKAEEEAGRCEGLRGAGRETRAAGKAAAGEAADGAAQQVLGRREQEGQEAGQRGAVGGEEREAGGEAAVEWQMCKPGANPEPLRQAWMAVEVFDGESGLALRFDDKGFFCREPASSELPLVSEQPPMVPAEDWALVLPGSFGLDQRWHSEDGTKTMWPDVDGDKRVLARVQHWVRRGEDGDVVRVGQVWKEAAGSDGERWYVETRLEVVLRARSERGGFWLSPDGAWRGTLAPKGADVTFPLPSHPSLLANAKWSKVDEGGWDKGVARSWTSDSPRGRCFTQTGGAVHGAARLESTRPAGAGAGEQSERRPQREVRGTRGGRQEGKEQEAARSRGEERERGERERGGRRRELAGKADAKAEEPPRGKSKGRQPPPPAVDLEVGKDGRAMPKRDARGHFLKGSVLNPPAQPATPPAATPAPQPAGDTKGGAKTAAKKGLKALPPPAVPVPAAEGDGELMCLCGKRVGKQSSAVQCLCCGNRLHPGCAAQGGKGQGDEWRCRKCVTAEKRGSETPVKRRMRAETPVKKGADSAGATPVKKREQEAPRRKAEADAGGVVEAKAGRKKAQVEGAGAKRKADAEEGKAAEAKVAKKNGKQWQRKQKETESRVLAQTLAAQGLCLIEIPADGHCLFSAISDQLRRAQFPEQHTYKSLRRLAAEYMLEHEADFRDFLALERHSFQAYCRRMEKTNTWGGQHEIIALCHVLQRNIRVFRHDMSQQQFPDPETHPSYDGPDIRLSYHMHEYSGGEHYNSVVTLEEKHARRSRVAIKSREEAEAAAALQPANPLPAHPADSHPEGAPSVAAGEGQERAGSKRKSCQDGERAATLAKDRRIPVVDTRSGRVLMGHAAPKAPNIERYLAERPHMRLWNRDEDGTLPRAVGQLLKPPHSLSAVPATAEEAKPAEEPGGESGGGSAGEEEEEAEEEVCEAEVDADADVEGSEGEEEEAQAEEQEDEGEAASPSPMDVEDDANDEHGSESGAEERTEGAAAATEAETEHEAEGDGGAGGVEEGGEGESAEPDAAPEPVQAQDRQGAGDGVSAAEDQEMAHEAADAEMEEGEGAAGEVAELAAAEETAAAALEPAPPEQEAGEDMDRDQVAEGGAGGAEAAATEGAAAAEDPVSQNGGAGAAEGAMGGGDGESGACEAQEGKGGEEEEPAAEALRGSVEAGAGSQQASGVEEQCT